ncbi:MAG: helix-turn-helix transcriptional regulator [Cyanobacteria bacterium J06649_11]
MKNEKNVEVGKRLKHLRIANNKQQQDIADFLNISRPAYSNIENGVNAASLERLQALSTYYQISIDAIVTGNDFRFSNLSTDINYAEEGEAEYIVAGNSDLLERIEVLENDMKIVKKFLGDQIDRA